MIFQFWSVSFGLLNLPSFVPVSSTLFGDDASDVGEEKAKCKYTRRQSDIKSRRNGQSQKYSQSEGTAKKWQWKFISNFETRMRIAFFML